MSNNTAERSTYLHLSVLPPDKRLPVNLEQLPFASKSLPTFVIPKGTTLSRRAIKEAERVAFHVVHEDRYPPNQLKEIRERDKKVFDFLCEIRKQFTRTESPLITASRSGHREFDEKTMVLSRAHLTQMLGVEKQPDFDSFGIDLAEMLTYDSMNSLCKTGGTGRLIVRSNVLRKAHEMVAPVLRKFLKLEPKFKPTIETLFANPSDFKGKPITAFHYAVGNALIDHLVDQKISDVPVVMYLSDPHIHENYLIHKKEKFVYFFTFDQKTADELINVHKIPKERVCVAGFPISPRLEVKKPEDKIKQEFAPKYDKEG